MFQATINTLMVIRGLISVAKAYKSAEDQETSPVTPKVKRVVRMSIAALFSTIVVLIARVSPWYGVSLLLSDALLLWWKSRK